ncbi:cold shock domain-containing protein [Streptomyces sp. NPDC096013]|uniref:cold shock domain-containing protein n=1 Tax=Streptomyces sp. NPDC096013 TaxID=3366069 RepID=UPI0038215C0E
MHGRNQPRPPRVRRRSLRAAFPGWERGTCLGILGCSWKVNSVASARTDVFVHFSAVQSGGYCALEEDPKVEFEVTAGPKGPRPTTFRSSPDENGGPGPAGPAQDRWDQLVQPVTGAGPAHWSGWLPVTEPGTTVALAPSVL